MEKRILEISEITGMIIKPVRGPKDLYDRAKDLYNSAVSILRLDTISVGCKKEAIDEVLRWFMEEDKRIDNYMEVLQDLKNSLSCYNGDHKERLIYFCRAQDVYYQPEISPSLK